MKTWGLNFDFWPIFHISTCYQVIHYMANKNANKNSKNVLEIPKVCRSFFSPSGARDGAEGS